jgi:hypothetical protein
MIHPTKNEIILQMKLAIKAFFHFIPLNRIMKIPASARNANNSASAVCTDQSKPINGKKNHTKGSVMLDAINPPLTIISVP